MSELKVLCRCPWLDLSKEDYVLYHDTEWGLPVHEDRKLFECLILEGAQAGLGWYTVLKKRENYRKSFDGFDPEKIASYDLKKENELLLDSGIIRNRAKIKSAIANAQAVLQIQDEYSSFSDYLWQFVDGRPVIHSCMTSKDYRSTSPESDKMSKELKRRGFSFVGSTICYAFMQATGMVNDHLVDCFRWKDVQIR